jgi:hypothetical protein
MTKNQEIIQGLRDLLAFVEANEDFDFAPGTDTNIVEMAFRAWYQPGEDRQRIAIGNLTQRMAHRGKVEKLYGDEFAWIRLQFGKFVRLDISTLRKTICERVIVGKKLVPAQPERVLPATPETTVDEVEWRCHPVLVRPESTEVPEDLSLTDGGAPLLEAEVEF